MKYRIIAAVVLVASAFLAYGFIQSLDANTSLAKKFPFSFGLDLTGGTELTYKAHTEKLSGSESDALAILRDVIERRVNVFGVSEPLVQLEDATTLSGTEHHLLVELPGVTDIQEAIARLGETPTLEFYVPKPGMENAVLQLAQAGKLDGAPISALSEGFEPSGITGEYLSRATLNFTSTANEPQVSIAFNDTGATLLQQVTAANKGKIMAIVLDGTITSAPTIMSEIPNGQAEISGRFTVEQAKKLADNLNYGALPVPIELIGTQTIGPTLGAGAIHDGVYAGLIGTLAVMIFLVLWYRLPGIVASVALSLYIVLSLVAFKLFNVALTAAGIAGFILSIGMAVDANILIFERAKEELAKGRGLKDALHEGFHRAWLSIRDSNISSMITAVILFWVGTSAVKGFALTLGLGVAISMFTALTLSRTFLFAIVPEGKGALSRFLFSAGFHSGKKQSQ